MLLSKASKGLLFGRSLNGSVRWATTKVLMPALSPTMESGKIVKWQKKEGDKVEAGEVLFRIETDKATLDVDSPEPGIVAKILVNESSDVINVGKLIALIVEEGDDWKNVQVPKEDAPAAPAASTPAPPAPKQEEKKAQPTPAPKAPESQGTYKGEPLSPAVKILIESYKIDANKIRPTGPKNRILKGDILSYLESNPNLKRVPALSHESSHATVPKTQEKPKTPLKVPGAKYVEIPQSDEKKNNSLNMVQNKLATPHEHANIECVVDDLQKWTEEVNKASGLSLNVLDFIVKSFSISLNKASGANVSWENNDVKSNKGVSIRVKTPSSDSLIPNAEKLGLADISKISKSSQASSTAPFWVETNEVSIARGLLPQGCTALLSVSPSFKRIKEIDETTGKAKLESVVSVSLSYDARLLDVATVDEVLNSFSQMLQSPEKML